MPNIDDYEKTAWVVGAFAAAAMWRIAEVSLVHLPDHGSAPEILASGAGLVAAKWGVSAAGKAVRTRKGLKKVRALGLDACKR